MMKKSLLLITLLLLNSCSRAVLIDEIALPPVSLLEGRVTRIDQGGFMLQDSSGSIFISAELPGQKPLNLSLNEQVKAYGTLRPGSARIFDSCVIKKQSGALIMISKPQPHFGFVIQTAFEE
jgi:hypothetical protein